MALLRSTMTDLVSRLRSVEVATMQLQKAGKSGRESPALVAAQREQDLSS